MSGTSRTDLPRVTRQDGETFVVLAPGCVDELASQLGRLGRKRAYLVTGSSLASGRVGQTVRNALGEMIVGMFSGVRPHVPVETAEHVANEAQSLSADVLIGLGGGSPIGTAKAAVSRLAGGTTASDVRWMVAAIPTTYAGSEVTPVFGTTDVAHGRKEVVRNPGIRPRLVLYDPELAIDTPPDLTAGTGINALAHCVEGLYSNDAGDEERAMAVHAATLLVEHLTRAFARPEDLAHRYHLFEASMLAGLVLARAGMGVHHGLCHVLGGRYNAQHGVLNAIILSHAMRFNLPVAGSAYAQLAPVFGLKAADSPRTGEAVCRAVTDFIRQFRLPSRLRDLGIPRTDLPAVAAEAMQSQSVRRNPRPLRDPQDALQILEAAW
jgi:alcohol dehydrogenase class IV